MIEANELRIGNWVKILSLKDALEVKLNLSVDQVLYPFEHPKEEPNMNAEVRLINLETVVLSVAGVAIHFSLESIYPIPLTPELLFKAGINIEKGVLTGKPIEEIAFAHFRFDYNIVRFGFLEEPGFPDDFNVVREVQYLHEFQNLSFALHSRELGIIL